MKALIVNADDFGWTEGVSYGIIKAHLDGIVTSTSLLANGPAFRSAAEISKSVPNLGIGVHLNLSDGPPVADADVLRTLVDTHGSFLNGPEALLVKIKTRKLSLAEVEKEWDAQIGQIRSAGVTPTHLDGHKHVHMLPGLFEIALRLANRHNIRAIRISHEDSRLRAALSAGKSASRGLVLKQRVEAKGIKLLARNARNLAARAGIATADYFCGIAHTGVLTKEGVARLLRNLPEGITELMIHPGFADQDLRTSATRLQDSRQRELDILTDAEVRNLVASEGIRLIDYGRVALKA